MKWIAAAFDGAEVCAIADTPEKAEEIYVLENGAPEFGFWRFSNRVEYREALKGIGVAMGFDKEKSIPVYLTGKWICVTPIAQEAIRRVQLGGLKSLVNDWTAEDGSFCVNVKAPAPVTPRVDRPKNGWEAFVPLLAGVSIRLNEYITSVHGLDALRWNIESGTESPLSRDEFDAIMAAYEAFATHPNWRVIQPRHMESVVPLLVTDVSARLKSYFGGVIGLSGQQKLRSDLDSGATPKMSAEEFAAIEAAYDRAGLIPEARRINKSHVVEK